MTQEIKQKLEQAAEKYWYERVGVSSIDFKAGAQTILENPGEWGLVDVYKAQQSMCDAGYDIMQLKSQLSKYREALKRILQGNCSPTMVAKEALKQEDTTCPKCGYPLFKHLGKACCQGCDYVKQQ